jgi:predicted transposase/invertase (TIGR01784 family)
MSKSRDYDGTYKYLFSNKRIFYQLIKSFVKEDFITDISLDDITLVDRSFVSDEFLSRESDIIYKVNLKDVSTSLRSDTRLKWSTEAYIYILLEFQSTVDKTIPIRMALYTFQFYDLLFRNSQKGLLPSVFPILLYTGPDNWTIPSNIRDLIDKRIPEKYIPSFEYYKIIEKDIPDEVLLKLHNLISAIIYLEKRKDEKSLREAIDKVIELIKNENIIDIRMFTIWFRRMFRQKVEVEEYNKITNLTEVNNMLTAIADEIMEKGIKKGKIEGKLEGKIEGKIEGKLEEKREVAKKLKDEGLDIALISRTTGLTEEEIEKL